MKHETRLTPFMRIVALAIALVVPLGTAPVSLNAATFFWDPDLNPANNVFGTQAGLGGASTWNATNLNWWDGISADSAWVAGDIASFGGTAGGAITFGDPIDAGGLIFTTTGYTTTLTAANTLTLSGSAIIQGYASASIGTAAIGGIVSTVGLTKNGGGTLTVLGTNSLLTTMITVNAGTLVSSGDTAALGSALPILMYGGTISLLHNQGLTSNNVAALAYGSPVLIRGNSTINVGNAGANTNNTNSISSLTLGNNTVTMTAANGYGLQVALGTTLGGAISTLNTAINPLTAGAAGALASANNTASMFALTGVVSGGALNKTGAGTVVLQNTNTYAGGTNILQGTVLLNTSVATLGTGPVIVNPGAALGVTNAANTLGAGTISFASTSGSVSVLGVSSNVDVVTGSSLGTASASPYGAVFALSSGETGVATGFNFSGAGAYGVASTYTNAIDMSLIGSTTAGNGVFFLGASGANTALGVGAAISNGLTGPIRLGGGGSTLILAADNLLNTASTSLAIGSPIGNVQAIAGGTGTVNIRETNSLFTSVVTVNKGSTLQVGGLVDQNPLGSGTVNVRGTLDTTATNYTGPSPQLSNAINVYQSVATTNGLLINNSAVTLAGGTTDLRLAAATVLGLYSGAVTYTGSNTATTTTNQTIGTVNASGGNVITVATTATAANNADPVLTMTNLNRTGAGTVAFARTGSPTAFGTSTASNDSRVFITNLNGVAPVVTNGMIAPYLVEGTSNTFLTYDVNGIAPVVYDVTATTSLLLTGATDVQKVDMTAAIALLGNATMQALRIGNFALTQTGGPFTVTIGANAGVPATDGAGLILNNSAVQTHTPNWDFGGGGDREAVIFTNGGSNPTLSGAIAATGLTKFGANVLILTGANTALTGTLTVNQGTLQGSVAGLNFRPVTLNAGTLNLSTSVGGNYLNAVTVNGDSAIDAAAANQARIDTLTIAARTGSTDPVVFTVATGGLAVRGATTLSGPAEFNLTGNAGTLLGGPLVGISALTKWGGQALIATNGASIFSGPITVNAGVLASQTGRTADTPFGTAAITVNPGGALRVANPANLTGNAVTVNSDLAGLGVISMIYNGGASTPVPSSYTFNNANLNAPFSAVLSVDAVGFSGALDLSAAGFANGRAFLGSTLNGNYTGTITPSATGNTVPALGGGAPAALAGNVYRLGGGGGILNLLSVNQLTGGATDAVQVGAISNVTAGASVALVNGGGTVQVLNTNTYSGNTYLNTGGALSLGDNSALASSKLIFNGGAIQSDATNGLPTLTATRTLGNAIGFTGDAVFAGATDLKLTASFGLADGQNGVTRTLNVTNTAGVVELSGVISDGAGGLGNSITKVGAGALVLSGVNTYTGYTNLNGGTLVLSRPLDADFGASSTITMSGGAIGAWNTSITTNKDIWLIGVGVFDVGAAKTLTQGAAGHLSGAGALTKAGLGTLVLDGINSNTGAINASNGIVQVGGLVNMGTGAGAIVFGGGALRSTGSFSTNRLLTATGTGAVDIISGQTVTVTGVVSGALALNKTGAGELAFGTAVNTGVIYNVQNGTLTSLQTGTFIAAATGILNVNGGTLRMSNGAAVTARIVTALTLNSGAGGHLSLDSLNATGSEQLTLTNLNRAGAGTLIIEVANPAEFGVAGVAADRVRVVSTNILGATAAAAITNGIYAPSLVLQSGGIGGFLTTAGATGLAPYTGAFTSMSGAPANFTLPAAIGDAGAGGTLTGTNAIYAFKTAGSVSGGTLKITSINNTTNEGGILVNATATISSNLIFDPSAAAGGGLGTSGEGILYTAPGATATVSGQVIANNFVKFGGGTLVLNGAGQSILGALTVQEGNLRVAAASNFNKLQTDLVLNNQGVLDLNGGGVTVKSLGNSTPATVMGGRVTNNGGSAAVFTVNMATGPIASTSTAITQTGTPGQNNQVITALASTANLVVGMPVFGQNVAAGATIQSIDSATAVTLRALGNNANVAAAANTMSFGPIFFGQIADGTSTVSVAKSGNGTLALGGYHANNPDAGNNSFSGGTTLNQGTLLVETPLGLGGFVTASNPTGAVGAINLLGGTLDLRNNGGGINGTIILGNQSGTGATVNVRGPATINVDRLTAFSGNVWQIGALNLTENTLTVTGANNYRLRVAGPTTIVGAFANIANGSDVSALVLDGVISGSGALNKVGASLNQRVLTINGTANTYSGGTNIINGMVQVTGDAGNPLGTGTVKVFAGLSGVNGGILRIAGNSSLGAATLQTHSRVTGAGMVALDNDFVPTVLTSANFSGAYGVALGLSQPFFNTTLNMSTISDGKAFLGGGIGGVETAYIAPTLGAGVANALGSPSVYRLAGGAGALAFTGANNVLSGNAYLEIGNPLSNTGVTQTLTAGGVVIRNSNSFTRGVTIAKGSTLTLDVGSSPTGSTPLGSADGTLTGAATNVEVFGTISLGSPAGYPGVASYVNNATGKNANNFILRPGSLITITDIAGNPPGGQGRWADLDANGGALDLNGGTFRFTGAANYSSTETVGTFTVSKGSGINVVRPAGSGDVTLTLGALARTAGNTLALTHTANILGIPNTAAALQPNFEHLIVTGGVATAGTTTQGPGALTGGIVAPWAVDATDNSFLTYNPTAGNTGFQSLVTGAPTNPNQVGYGAIVTTGTYVAGTLAGVVVDVNTAALVLTDDPTVHALRVGAVNISPSGASDTVTISSGGLLFNGASTINPVVAGTPLASMTLAFGAAEALIYSSAAAVINAQITGTAGLTKFGASSLQINSVNPGLTGTIAVNAGTLTLVNALGANATSLNGAVNNQEIVLNGGTLNLAGAVGNRADTAALAMANNPATTTNLGSNITFAGDATLTNNNVAFFQRINNLTINNIATPGTVTEQSAVTATINTGIYVNGTTTLGANNNNISVNFQQFSSSVLGGAVSGGTLVKFGNGTLLMASGANTYAATVINGASQNDATSIVGSLTRTGNPFGTGPITVNPGGMLRIADPTNITSNLVTLKSDGSGLAGIAISYNGALPTFGALPGQINATKTGAFGGVVALDINAYTTALSLSTIGDGTMWLGTSVGSIYFAQTLGASGGVYRLGGGGNQGNFQIGGSTNTVGLFENVLAGGNNVEIGAMISGINASGSFYVNGNKGTVSLNNRNTGLTSANYVSVNAGTLAINNAFAIGNAVLKLNGGALNFNNLPTLSNSVMFMGDSITTTGGADASFTGTVDLMGGTRTFNMAQTAANHIGFQGVIFGAAGSNVIKTGASVVAFNGTNTYAGTTTINQGAIAVGTDVLPGVNGALGNSDTPIIFGNAVANATGQILLAGQVTFGRDIIQTANGTGVGLIRGQTLNNSVVTGGIAVTNTTLQIDSVQIGAGTFQGGMIDIAGPITGAGAIQIGNTNVQGTVKLTASSNGFGTNTYSGGTTLQAGRLQVGTDTYFTGLASAPTIISGPLGTGTLTFGAGNANSGGSIEAIGGSRTIINALAGTNTAATTTVTFNGKNSLTFTRALDLGAPAANQSREFAVRTTGGSVTFSGVLSNSGVLGTNFVKNAGVGTLVLSGANTQISLDPANANYGTTAFIDTGVLSVSAETNLGAAAVTVVGTVTYAADGAGTALTHAAASPSDIRLRGGVLQVTGAGLSTGRSLIVTAATGGIDVPSGTLTFTAPVLQALALPTTTLTKTGAGTLAFNGSTLVQTSITNLVIGGAPLVTAANQYAGISGGTVSTTAITGSPFVKSTGAITINGGNLALLGATASLTVATVNYGGGSYISTNAGGATLTATALARSGQGTLTLLPSALANLGVAEIVTTSSVFGNTNGTLTSPSVLARLSGANQPATFVQFLAPATGFGQVTYSANTLALGALATDLIDVPAAGDTLNVTDVYALRTAGNIATGSSLTLNIGNGGLIMNPGVANAAATVAPNLVFGTSAALAQEALVYVADTATGTPTLSGAITATNFTKSGPGTLLLSGTGSVMAPINTGLRTLAVNEGTVKFAGASSLPSGGLINIATFDSGTFDMNGLALTIGGLSGTGIVTNTGAAQILTTAVNNQTTTFNGLLDGGANVSLAKTGTGILVLGGRNTYSGGTTINAGNITSAMGTYVPTGTLTAGAFDALGTGGVTLQGGILNINVTTAPNEVDDAVNTIQFGLGNGYDITIAALTNGVASWTNKTSTINTTGTTGFQAVNSLTINAPVLNFLGASANGLLVKGTTSVVGDTVLNLNQTQQVVLGGTLSASGRVITKLGGATLFLTNTGTGSGPDSALANSVGEWDIMAGAVEARMSQGGSNPLGSATPVTLNGGQLNLRHDGDNLLDPQVLSSFAGNNLTIGVLASPSSANFMSSANSTISIDRLSGGSNKTIQIGSVAFGGRLGAGFVTMAAGNNQTLEITGGITMIKDAYLALNNTQTTIDGVISGNGTLFKQGGADLNVNTTSNTATGGTVLAGGSTYFGSFAGNTRTLSTTSQLAAGNITVQPGALLRFTAITNMNGAQLVDVRSNLNTYGVIGIGDNTALASYDLRVPQASGFFSGNMQTAPTTGAGVLAINSVYTSPVNLGTIGDGTWFLGSTTNGSFQQGSYNAATLGAGKPYNFGTASPNNTNSVVRLGGGGSTIYIGSNFTNNALTDLCFGASLTTSLVVGAPLTSSAATTIGNGTGLAFITGNQNYTGATLVNRGSTLEIRGSMTSPSYETFGFLQVNGDAGRFFNGATAIQPTLRPGSELGLRNDFGLLPVAAVEGRYGDATPVALNSSTLRLVGSNAADIKEVVGAVTAAGGSLIIPNRSFSGRITELNLASLARVGQGQLSIQPATATQLGSDERVTTAGVGLAAQILNIPGGITNGMVAPWMYNAVDAQFLTYSDFGFVNAGFDRATGGALVTNPSAIGATERLLVNAAATIAAATTVSAWAVRADASIAGTNAETLSIGSGGLISNVGNNVTVGITTPAELIIGNQVGNMIIGTLANLVSDTTATGTGAITATAISKTGDGSLFLDTDHTTFTGPIALNRGSLFIRDADATATTSNNGGAGSTITINGSNSVLGYRADITGEAFNNSVVLGAGNALTQISFDRAASTTATGVVIQLAGGITFGGAPGDQGQALTTTNGNTYQLQVNGTTNLGPAGNAVFNVAGTTGTVTLGGAAGATGFTAGAGTAGTAALTGAGTLIKTGASQMNIGVNAILPTVASTNTGGIVLQQGVLQINAGTQAAANGNIALSLLGSGDITLVGGALQLRADGDTSATSRTYLYNTNANVNVVGNTTIDLNRVSAAAITVKTLAFPNLNIGGQTLTVTSANTYSLRFNAAALTGTPTFNTGNELILSGVSDGGSGLYVVKNGGSSLWFADRTIGNATPNALNTFSGGIYVNAGLLRFGTPAGESGLNTAGNNQIQLNATGAVRLVAGTNINTGAGQKVTAIGSVAAPAVVRILGAGSMSPAQLGALLNSTSSNGILRVEAAYASPLNLATIGDGNFYFGSQGNISYTANTLGVGNGATYRLGTNDAVASVLTLAPALVSSPVLTGANSVSVGSLAVGGAGSVLLNATNNYTGSTMVARGSILRFNTGATQGFAGSGLLDTPLSTSTVDAFGTITAEGTPGTFVNQAQTAATNAVVLHPGGVLRFDNNTTLAAAVTAASSGTAVITALPSTAGLSVGMAMISTTATFPTGLTIFSIDSATQITLSGAVPVLALAGVQFASNNRWLDTAPIALNGSHLFLNGITTGVSAETVGSVSFARGSQIRLLANGTGGEDALTLGGASTLSRVGNGTMVIDNGGAARLGLAPGTSTSERLIVAGGTANISGSIINGMLPGYYIALDDNAFVTYGANGFAPAAFTNTNFAAGFTNASIVDLAATTALAGDASIYALRVGAFTLNSAVGQFNTVTLNGAGTAGSGGGVLFSGAGTIATNLSFNGFEGLIYANAAGVISGDISGVSAAGITKFGLSTLAISKDQSSAARGPGNGYTNGWTVNEGALIANFFGALGDAVPANTVTLNGYAVTGVATPSALTLNANQGSALNEFYSMGNLLVTDNGQINHNIAADRTQSLGAPGSFSNIIITSTGGSLLEARLAYTNNQQRSLLQVGDVSLVGVGASAILDITAAAVNNNFTSGAGTGLSIASLSGAVGQTFKKRGNGELYIRGASTFAGNVSIEQGPIGVFNVASLGTGSVSVKRYGTLDIWVAGGVSNVVTYEAGGIERWSVDGARTGAVALGAGTLQINNDQTGAAAVTLNGGSIEGFIKTDDNLRASNGNQGAVYRTLGSLVTVTLAGNSFVGQNINQGVNGFDNGAQANAFQPFGAAAAGVILEIKGQITGVGGLTKQGYDVVTLSNATNTYAGGTTLLQGMLRAGAANVLGSNDNTLLNIGKGNLSTTGAAVFDLNGFDQMVGRLTSPSTGLTAATTNLAGSGYVTNSSTELKTLAVGNGATLDSVYGGVIQYNVNLTKVGSSKQTLTNINTYVGATTVNSGTLEVTHVTGGVIDGISGTSSLTVTTGGTFSMRPGVNANEILTLAPWTGTALTLTGSNRIGMEVGTGTVSSQLALNTGALAFHSGATAIDVYGISGSAPTGTATVISAPSGGLLTTNGSSGSYVLGNVYNNTNFTVTGVTQTDTLVTLGTAAATPLTAAFWKGGFAGNTNVWAVSNGSTLSNWATDLAGTNTGLVPGSGTNVSVSVTSPTDQNNMVLGSNMSISTLTLNSTSGTPVVLQSTGAYTLSIGGAAAITTDVSSGTATLNSKVALTSATPAILVNSASLLTIAGEISGAATSLTKSGTGTLLLTTANSHAGTTLVTAGILSITNGNALGAADATVATRTVVSAGASLELSGGIAVNPNELLQINGVGVGTTGALRNLSGNNIYGGLLSLGLASRIQSDASLLTLSHPGTITGATFGLTVAGVGNTTIASIIGTTTGTLTKLDTGLLTLNGASTYTGLTTISAGTVSITNALGLGTAAGTTTVAAGSTLNISNASSGEIDVTINGTGDATLANAAFTGGALTGTGIAAQTGTVIMSTSSTIAATTPATLFTVSGVISGPGSNLTTAGPGTTQLNTAINTYGGSTTVSTGTLQLGTTGTNKIPDGSAVTVTTGATFDVNGQTETIGSLAGGGAVTLGIGALTTGSNGTNTNYTGVMSGTGTLTKIGVGTQTLTGINTYTGLTTVTAGTLEVNGTTGGPTAAGTTVGASGTLAGNGLIAGTGATHTVTGFVSPGTTGGLDFGTLTFQGSLTFNPTSTLTLQIDSPVTQGTTYDSINVAGLLTLDSLLNINVSGFSTHTPIVGDTWNLLDWGTIAVGGFSPGASIRPGGLDGTLTLPLLGVGLLWDVSTFTSNGNIVVVVPEPSRMLLIFFGLAALFLRRRRNS